MNKVITSAVAATVASTTISAATAETNAAAVKPNVPWWKRAVFYEIYPRSFADSNGDGIGDINGITSKLDYLAGVGIDAIWITPCFPSPQVDFGYDISDYEDIAPEFGTLADYDKLVAEGDKRKIRVILDFVLNHSSDKHKWFLESKSSRDNPKRDWFIWRDGKNGGPPNNWVSIFGHSAWTYDPTTKQYYYHLFYPEQPDLNWRNPEVRKAMYDVARFWFKRGAYGFRLDAVGAMFEDPALPDNPVLPGTNKFGDPNTEFKHNSGLPELHEVLKELRKVSDEFPDNRVLIGETFTTTVAELSKMYGDNDELQLPMNFFFAYINKRSAPEFRKQIALWDKNPAGGWPVYLLSNHDTPRHYVRYGDGKNNDSIAKLMATMVLTLRGTPILYYGEEIGMTNNDPTRVEDVQDPIGKIGWPKEKGRDGERTPMHWNAGKHAGFTTGDKPWLPVAPNYTTHNVESEEKDPNSILSTYKSVIALRRTHPALLDGSYEPMNEKDPHLLSYLRKSENGTVLVVLNMANRKRNAKFDFSGFGPQCEGSSTGKVLFSTFGTPPGTSVDLNRVQVPAYGALIIEV